MVMFTFHGEIEATVTPTEDGGRTLTIIDKGTGVAFNVQLTTEMCNGIAEALTGGLIIARPGVN